MDLYNTWIVTTPIAHRGLHNENFPENSKSAFANAIKNHYAIELDVMLTIDKYVVVHHDYSLKRSCGIDKLISECSYEEISQYQLFGTGEQIMLFSELLRFVNGQVPLLIEVKNEGKVGVLEGLVIAQLKDYKGEFAVQSFNPLTLNYFRKNAPQIIRGLLASKFKKDKISIIKKIILKNMLLNWSCRPDFISYNVDDLPCNKIKKSKKKPILAWVVDSKNKYDEKCKYFDNQIFEKYIPINKK